MISVTSLPMPSTTHLIGLLCVKLIAVAVTVIVDEEAARRIVPVVALVYALGLPLILWIAAP